MKKTVNLAVILLLSMFSIALAEKADPTTPVYYSNSFSDRSYHLGFCPIVTRGFGKNQVTLQAAIDKKKNPCKKCKPPTALTHRIVKSKPKKIKVANRRISVGSSAADFERDPDGTVVGNGGGFSVSPSKRPIDHSSRGLAAHEKIQEYDILEIKTKLTDSSSEYDTVSFLVTVRNLSKKSQTVNLSLQGIDADGFELENKFVMCALPANAVEICTGQTMYKSSTGHKIKEWRAK